MNYPLISEYIEAIKAAEDNFDQLKNLRPVLDDNGLPIMSGGNFAVVFKMKDVDTGKIHAVKCFLKEQEGRAEAYRQITEELENVSSDYLISIQYLDKELFVDSSTSDENEFPVLLMDWVEGQTLDKHLREHIDDEYELSILVYQFSCLAMWMLQQPFAHGDLKPDNILVKEDGSLVLVDYDGLYVPAMKGQKARELGSPDFRHPGRTEDTFDEHMDDFPLVSILLSLKAISLKPELLEQYGASDRLLFSEKDYRNLSGSKVMDALKSLMNDSELATLYSLFILSFVQNNLSQASYRLLELSRPTNTLNLKEINKLCSIDWYGKCGYKVDEFGAIYSHDYKVLFSLPADVVVYNIKDGTEIVANNAFNHFVVAADSESVDLSYADLELIYLPSSVIYITDKAFGEDGHNLKEIGISSNKNYYVSLLGIFSDRVNKRKPYDKIVTNSKSTFDESGAEYSMDGDSLLSLYNLLPDISCYQIKKGVINVNARGISSKGLAEIIVPQGVESISGFSSNSLKSIVLPTSLKTIHQGAFEYSKEFVSIEIPEGVRSIEEWAFLNCRVLENVVLPSTLIKIGYRAFACNTVLKTIRFKSCPSIGRDCFDECPSLQEILIPKGTTKQFENKMPEYKDKFVELDDVCYYSLEVTKEELESAWIDEYGVKYSTDMKRLLKAPNDLTGYSIREGTKVICNGAFKNINEIAIPDSVTIVGMSPFGWASHLKKIFIPIGTKSKFDGLLPNYINKIVELLDLEKKDGWKVKERRSFSPEEIASVRSAQVVNSRYGKSVRFLLNSGLQTYIPLVEYSNLLVGDNVDLSQANVVMLCREGGGDIYRVEG